MAVQRFPTGIQLALIIQSHALPIQACVFARPTSKKCRHRHIGTATATVSCIPGLAGAPGTLAFNFTAAASAAGGGYMITSTPSVVATCAGSRFSDMSTCSPASAAMVTTTAAASSVAMASAEWDSNCVCTATGRRPVMKVDVPKVVVGAACKG
jgi:hypothetical protein